MRDDDEAVDDDWADDPFEESWTVEPLRLSRAHGLLQDDYDDEPNETALERERERVTNDVAEAATRAAGGPGAVLQELYAETAPVANAVAGLGLAAGQLYVHLRRISRGGIDYEVTAAFNLVQSAQTTLGAIALLLRHGYVLDAEARWRGLHELACTAALLAVDDDPKRICMRYLAHGERLLADDPAYRDPAVREAGFFGKNYEWLRGSYSNVTGKGKPAPFTQRWLFNQANLDAGPFQTWLQPSHGPVHLSSRAVAEGNEQAGAAPAGYSAERMRQVAWQAGCSSYELVANVLTLPDQDAMPVEQGLAWIAEVRARVDAMRPAPVGKRPMSPAEQLGLL